MILLVVAALAGTATSAAEAGHGHTVGAARTSRTAVRPDDGSRGTGDPTQAGQWADHW